MGNLTRLQIVQQGTLQAERDDADTLAAGWLQRWLNSVAAAVPWPMLTKEAIGVTVTTPSLTVGDGSGGVTAKILRILDNTWIYPSGRTARAARLRIRTQLTDPNDRVYPTTTGVGKPDSARVFQESLGQWTMYFNNVPDQTYSLTLAHIIQGAQLSSDTDVPWYPNDETMIQAVAFSTHRYFDGKDAPETQAVQEDLAAMFASDKLRYGAVNGINDKLQLNPTRFRNANRP